MRKGPHFNLIPARNYTKISEDVDEQTWKVEGRGAKGYMSASNFPDILFTEYRDYLVKYNGQRVHIYVFITTCMCNELIFAFYILILQNPIGKVYVAYQICACHINRYCYC